jgi:hypothetical protein
MRFKWGALLAVAALGGFFTAALCFCLPAVAGSAINTVTGQVVLYYSVLDMKRAVLHAQDTETSRLIQACPGLAGGKGELLAYRGQWYLGWRLSYWQWTHRRSAWLRNARVRTETDSIAPEVLDSVANYLNDVDWQRHNGIRYGFTAEGKAQLMLNMLEVLRRRGDSKYVTQRAIAPLMLNLDHAAGANDVPTAQQIIRKTAQFF